MAREVRLTSADRVLDPESGVTKGDLFAFYDAVADTEEFLAALDSGPADRVHEQAYLRARLMDLLLGDWDRGFDQWRYAPPEVSAPASDVPRAEVTDARLVRVDLHPLREGIPQQRQQRRAPLGVAAQVGALDFFL